MTNSISYGLEVKKVTVLPRDVAAFMSVSDLVAANDLFLDLKCSSSILETSISDLDKWQWNIYLLRMATICGQPCNSFMAHLVSLA